MVTAEVLSTRSERVNERTRHAQLHDKKSSDSRRLALAQRLGNPNGVGVVQ